MGAITSAVIAIAAVALGWITIEIACKPCLDKGRAAIDRSLNPDYDPDNDVNVVSSSPRAPLISHIEDPTPEVATDSSISSSVKAV